MCHLGCRKTTCSTVNKRIAQQTSIVTVLMSCDDVESDSVTHPTVDEQFSFEQSSTLPEPLPVQAALGLRMFYGTRKSKSTELKPVAVRTHAARLSRKPPRYNDWYWCRPYHCCSDHTVLMIDWRWLSLELTILIFSQLSFFMSVKLRHKTLHSGHLPLFLRGRFLCCSLALLYLWLENDKTAMILFKHAFWIRPKCWT